MMVSRRGMVAASAAAVTAAVLGGFLTALAGTSEAARKGRLKQSVSRWPYSKIPLPEFADACKKMGLAAIDLLQPAEWDIVRDHGLVSSMGYPTDRKDFLSNGFNNRASHAMLIGE